MPRFRTNPSVAFGAGDRAFPLIKAIAPRVRDYDAICSLGCGAGVQALAERFPKTPVYPGLNTQFIGILESQGVWTEKCAGCGNCRLGEFGGICPVTRCAKRLWNGPCGGSREGKCEVNPDLECGWQLIYDRCRSLGIVEDLERIRGDLALEFPTVRFVLCKPLSMHPLLIEIVVDRLKEAESAEAG